MSCSFLFYHVCKKLLTVVNNLLFLTTWRQSLGHSHVLICLGSIVMKLQFNAIFSLYGMQQYSGC